MKLVPCCCKTPVIIMACVGVLIAIGFVIVNVFYRTEIMKVDPLNKKLFSVGPITVSWWPISHFILYTILGFLFPKCWLLIMVLGILWEIFEFITGLVLHKRRYVYTTKGVQYNDKWWAPNVFDPLFNALGFLTGYGLHVLYKK